MLLRRHTEHIRLWEDRKASATGQVFDEGDRLCALVGHRMIGGDERRRARERRPVHWTVGATQTTGKQPRLLMHLAPASLNVVDNRSAGRALGRGLERAWTGFQIID